VRTAAGQPQLEGIDGWFFSISYAGDLVGVASARCPVGLDLEPATRRPAAMLARRFASDERAYIAAAPGGAHGRDQRFLEIWTKKESYLKWRGCGLAAGLASFSVLQPARLGVQFWPVGASAGLMGHVCAATVGTTAGTLAAPAAAPTAAPSSQPD
jgi:4'-phosphopantetheinyl transferase